MLSDVKKISVERALDLLELVVVGHHDYIYEDTFDFIKTLVTKSNVDPDYVLSNYAYIINETCYGDFNMIVKEVESHVVKLTEDEIKDFLVKLAKYKEEYDYEKKQSEIRLDEIKNAKKRYQELRCLAKCFYTIKDGKPTNTNFDSKTVDDVKKMYKRK